MEINNDTISTTITLIEKLSEIASYSTKRMEEADKHRRSTLGQCLMMISTFGMVLMLLSRIIKLCKRGGKRTVAHLYSHHV